MSFLLIEKLLSPEQLQSLIWIREDNSTMTNIGSLSQADDFQMGLSQTPENIARCQ